MPLPKIVSGASVAAKAVAALIVVLVITIVVLAWKYRDAQAAQGKAALEAYNANARALQSVALMGSQLAAARKVFGDSIGAVTRLAVQVKQQNDRLDEALKQTRISVTQLTATVRALNTRVASGPTTEDVSGTRHATIDTTIAPYHVHADLTIPKPPAPVIANPLVVSVSPAVINLRTGCGAVDPNGIRAVRVTAEGPDWLPLQIGRVEQNPGVCPSPALQGASAKPCKVPGTFGFIPCPSRTVVFVAGVALGAAAGYEVAARKP